MTQHQGACSRGGPEGGSPPCTAAVSKHEIGTVTKQTTGATVHGRFCFAGGGGGGATPPGIYLTPLCPGRREVRPRVSTLLTDT